MIADRKHTEEPIKAEHSLETPSPLAKTPAEKQTPSAEAPLRTKSPAETLALPNEPFFEECAKMLAAGECITLRAKGSSMFPFIKDGDVVMLQKTGPVRIGDIVLAKTDEGRFVLHRIIEIVRSQHQENSGKVILMGDGNLQKKETADLEDIAGSVFAIYGPAPYGKPKLCNSTWERFKVALWLGCLPIRRILLKILRPNPKSQPSRTRPPLKIF